MIISHDNIFFLFSIKKNCFIEFITEFHQTKPKSSIYFDPNSKRNVEWLVGEHKVLLCESFGKVHIGPKRGHSFG